jgi:hypothetical protein
MKKFKKLIPALALLLVSAVLMSTASYAWFSMNRTVTATNLEVKAKASDSLVISNALAVGTSVTHAFTTAVSTLIPATHSDTYVESSAASAVNTTNGLKFVNNPADVNASTGVAETSKTLYFGDAVNSGTTIYYVDYVVYIASAGQAMANTDLEVYLYRDTALEKDTTRAVTVDFYFATESTSGSGLAALGTYAGKLDLSNLTKNTAGEWASTKLTLDTNDIPVNNVTDDYLKITMRVYFDGALTGTRYNKTTDSAIDGSKTYYTFAAADGFVAVTSPAAGSLGSYYEADANKVLVYTDVASTDAVAFNVNFTAKTSA